MNLLQSLTAKAAMPAKEQKSLTAKAAEDTKETIFEPTTEENAKTSPSMECPHARQRWTLVNLVVYHSVVAITSLGAVLADLGLHYYYPFASSAASAVKLSCASLGILRVLRGEAS